MNTDEKLALLKRNTEELITEGEIRSLLESGRTLRCYVGLEPSGLMHIGQGLIISRKLQDFRACGFDVIVFLADWHAYINDKLGGDIGKIRTCGKYIEDCFRAMGIGNGDPGVRFVYASELCGKLDYWEKVLRIAKSSSVARIKRSMTIMGRKEDEADADSSKLIYPSMQAADIFQMELDVAYSGIDQRKAHMLARDAAEKLGWKKPAALHTPLLTGLSGAQKADSVDAKMSKSTPDNCIFIHDGVDDIKRKIRKAYCPEGDVKGNPVIDIYKYIIFPAAGSADIERQEKHGGNLKFASFAELEAVFIDKKLHPMDLKDGAAKSLAGILKPVHEYFQKKPENFDAVRMMVMGK